MWRRRRDEIHDGHYARASALAGCFCPLGPRRIAGRLRLAGRPAQKLPTAPPPLEPSMIKAALALTLLALPSMALAQGPQPYAGLEQRPIKALSEQQVADLKA